MKGKILLVLIFCCMLFSISARAEYPKPDYSPPSVPALKNESETDGKVLRVSVQRTGSVPVVYPDKNNTYHMSGCKVYADNSDGTYSEPRYLTEVILDTSRCTECISDKIYYTFKEATYNLKINAQERRIEILSVINLVLALIISVYAVIKVLKNDKTA